MNGVSTLLRNTRDTIFLSPELRHQHPEHLLWKTHCDLHPSLLFFFKKRQVLLETYLFITLCFLFLFWTHLTACRILVSWPGIKSEPFAVQAQGLNHWTTREVPLHFSILTNIQRGSYFCFHVRYEELCFSLEGTSQELPPGSLTPRYFCLENSRDRGAWRAIVHGGPNGHDWAINTFHLPTTLFLKSSDHSEREIKQTMRQQEKWTWWPFQDLDNNGRQEPKKTADRHSEHLAQGITQVWIWYI